ncbi:PDDEXK nuclease domain-containing protein [Halotia branconii]|uniref:PDDEXK nuclease domain-containing protein n=1 Tax=Halotia branconii CENA392 TaxID=1539056 RepID=A0AAJ6PB77_9CYAN|nr:PDDEXK nuclease domain-containing protein [Halotia branconii]WGV27555.1 PDDEXK nuclease domain-containing protein [Halotia branconii CENA392]
MKGWINAKLEDLCIVGDGNHSSKYPKQSEMVAYGVPFIRGTNLVDGHILGDDILYISEEKHQELKKGHLKTGDVLFTNRGEIGKVVIVDEAFNGANLNSQIAWLRCQKELLPKYLFFFLQSAQMRRHFSQEKSGAALQQFTIRMIRAVVVSYPPIPEQKRIVAILDEAFEGIDRAIANTEKDLEDAILREIEQFLLELGANFTFIARQKRLQIDNDDFYIDLLFYNRKLKRLVASVLVDNLYFSQSTLLRL